jgi:hypothetical protein
MKKLIAVLGIVLFVGTIAAPAIQAFSSSNIVLTTDGDTPKDKKQDKKDAKCDKSEKKDCPKASEKKGCCSEKKNSK